MASSILLRGGTILSHDENDHVIPLVDTDVLISNDVIAKIGPNLAIPLDQDVEVIDCKGKIISPGFIDTHHHLWQTQLKGRHAEHGLVEYMVKGVHL
jgi:cytosine/adenosine deaminase-related metal-dependent hydrolase